MGYIRDCSAGHTDLKTTKSYSSGSSSRLRCLLHRSWKAQRIQPAPFNGRIRKLKWMPLVSCGLARQTPVSWQLPRVPAKASLLSGASHRHLSHQGAISDTRVLLDRILSSIMYFIFLLDYEQLTSDRVNYNSCS